jgi:hypothetical protein
MSRIRNRTGFPAEMVPLIDKNAHNIAVIIIKGTFVPDASRRRFVTSKDQAPIAFVDQFATEEGKGALINPADLCDYKPATDVIIMQPAVELVGSWLYKKRVEVELGPVHISGKVGPRWEFGPMRRDKNPRKKYAGTYDKDWINNRMPLLPKDFDSRYNQVAAESQQVPGYLKGDESVQLSGLTYSGDAITSALPGRAIVLAGNVLGRYFLDVAILDTVYIRPGIPEITLVWRYLITPRQKIEEVGTIYLDTVRLWSAREILGKP